MSVTGRSRSTESSTKIMSETFIAPALYLAIQALMSAVSQQLLLLIIATDQSTFLCCSSDVLNVSCGANTDHGVQADRVGIRLTWRWSCSFSSELSEAEICTLCTDFGPNLLRQITMRCC